MRDTPLRNIQRRRFNTNRLPGSLSFLLVRARHIKRGCSSFVNISFVEIRAPNQNLHDPQAWLELTRAVGFPGRTSEAEAFSIEFHTSEYALAPILPAILSLLSLVPVFLMVYVLAASPPVIAARLCRPHHRRSLSPRESGIPLPPSQERITVPCTFR